MQDRLINILSTRILDPSLIQFAQQNGIQIICIPFIESAYLEKEIIQQQIEKKPYLPEAYIFTSANAIKAVAQLPDFSLKNKKIYCLEGATLNAVLKIFPDSTIHNTAKNALELAKKIVSDNVRHLCFFCGDIRRDELPEILMQKGILIFDIVVYKTWASPQKLMNNFEGIMFFSPSAVKSFLSVNELPKKVDLFVIGETSAEEFVGFGNNLTLSSKPNPKQMVENVINFYKKIQT